MISRRQIVSQVQPGPEAHDPTERLEMGDLCALVDPSSGRLGHGTIWELPSGASEPGHIARLSAYLSVCFGAGRGAPGAGGAGARGGA
ncbi:MAG TPA: hypothetical protein VGP76_08190 [Planctomycetaceae bacterium]|nr:hypothetical protein [Planctomycetaceae bacterium]